jgi:hypothetical protein
MSLWLQHRVEPDHSTRGLSGKHVALCNEFDAVIGIAIEACEHCAVGWAKRFNDFPQRPR